MKKLYLLLFLAFCFIINNLHSSEGTPSDSLKKEKWKDFFSLKDSESVRSLSKITTSQDEVLASRSRWGLSLSGFIGFDLFWDTRQMTEARDGTICFYPKDILEDVRGMDINAHPSFNFAVMNTRLTVRIQAPDALKAKVSGMIEGWFMGASNNGMNEFALRHAFIKLDWKSTSLLLGQTWHPLFTERCFAETVAASTGAPFQPFARSPQIRLNQKFAKYSNLLLYLNGQRDYLSTGPNNASSEYLRNSAIPEAGIQYIVDYKKTEDEKMVHSCYSGIGFNYKYLTPRIVTEDGVYTKAGFSSGSILLFTHFAQVVSPEVTWGIKAKGGLFQACNEYLLLGGYAVHYYGTSVPNGYADYQYTPVNTVAAWFDFYTRIRSWEVGIFAGYSQNLGTLKTVQWENDPASYYGRSLNMAYLYRVSTRVKYSANKLQFSFEPEYTAACYGDTFTSHGKVDLKKSGNTRLIHGVRFLVSATLFF